MSFSQTELLRTLLLTGKTSSRQELSHHYVAHVAYGYLIIDKSNIDKSNIDLSEVTVNIPGVTCWGDFQLIAQWQDRKEYQGAKTSPEELYLHPEHFAGPLVLRKRQPGDFMNLPGGRKKLKKIMIDDKIPQEQRDTLPLLAAGSEVIWMIGRRRSANCLQGSADYHRILYLRIEKRGN